MRVAAHQLQSGVRCALLALSVLFCLAGSGLASAKFNPLPADRITRHRTVPAADCQCTAPFPAAGHFARVLIIVLENSDYKEAMADGYLRQLTREGAWFTNFHALFHPSYSNYLAMVSGKEIRTFKDRQVDLRNVCSIADLLESKGLEWKNYAQGYPQGDELDAYPNRCATRNRIGRYVRRHVPFMSFASIQGDAERCGRIVAATQFDVDRRQKTLPAYALYSPDLDNDGHDTGLQRASKWLQGFLDPLLDDADFIKETLVVVTFDESESNADNRVYTVFLGGMVQPGTEVEEHYDHFDVLRTIEENFGLCPLGAGDGAAKPIMEVWRQAAAPE